MESSLASQNHQYRVRSISLPSRSNPNSISTHLQSDLDSLKSWETTLFSAASHPQSSQTLRSGLVKLAELYTHLAANLESPTARKQALLRHENALDWSLGLIDSCCSIQEMFSTLKQQVQDLQSVLRRKGRDSKGEITAYICLRKRLNKAAAKIIKELKQMETKFGSIFVTETEYHVLREVSAITVSVFRSLLLFSSESDPKARLVNSNGWSVISKLMLKKTGIEQRIVGEMGSLDLALIQADNGDVKLGLKRLVEVEGSLQGIEGGLECLNRRFIQCRVSILNILNH